jgi:hypothetical protein
MPPRMHNPYLATQPAFSCKLAPQVHELLQWSAIPHLWMLAAAVHRE